MDERMQHALDSLKQERRIAHKYGYIWIMRYINEEHIKDIGLNAKGQAKFFFFSVNSFREYIASYMGHGGIAGISTLSEYYNKCSGRFPEWTFADKTGASAAPQVSHLTSPP